jgi:putative MATE family efflux protein
MLLTSRRYHEWRVPLEYPICLHTEFRVTSSEDLTAGSVGRHLTRLTVPMFLGISSMILASMIDTIYIGWIGTQQLAAVSFSFPVVMALSSVSMGLGMGATSIMSRTLGGGDRTRTYVFGTHTLLLVGVLVATLSISGWLFGAQLFRAMGADAVILPLVTAYMNVWFIGLPLFALPMVAMSMLRALGNARVPGTLMTAAAGLQVVLAPALIFGIPHIHDGIGYLGSAWAFVISRALTLLTTAYVLAGRGMFQPLGPLRDILQSWREVLRIGVPSILTNLIGPVSMAVVFGLLAKYGHAVVAGFGVAVRIESLALMVLMALSSSTSPFVGQNFGAGRADRIDTALELGYRFSIVWGVFAFVVLGGLGRSIVALINDDPAVIEATYRYLLIVPLSYSMMGVAMVAGSCFVALGKPLPSLILTITRMVLVYVPLALLFDRVWGYEGIFGASAVANVIVAGASYVWVTRMLEGATHQMRIVSA